MALRVISPLQNTNWSFEEDPNYKIIRTSVNDDFHWDRNADYIHIDNLGHVFIKRGAMYFYEVGSHQAMIKQRAESMGMEKARESLKNNAVEEVLQKINRRVDILRKNGCNVIYQIAKGEMKTLDEDPFHYIGGSAWVELAIFGKRETNFSVYGKSSF